MNKKTNKKRIKTISFLLMLSLVLTTGTFAFWASYVEGTSEEATGTLTVGYAEGVETTFELTNELNSGGYLVPTGQVNNSLEESVESIVISYDLLWQEDATISQLEGTMTEGKVSISHSLIIEVNGEELNSNIYASIFDLVKVEYSESNSTKLILDGETETFSFNVSMDEPADQQEYNIISNATISVIFSFKILDNFIETSDNKAVIDGAHMSLIGDEIVYVEITEAYEDEGIIAYNSLGEVIDNTWTKGEVNLWKLGTYELTYWGYSSYDNETLESISRTIVVIDTIAPVITMNGTEVVNVTLGSYFEDWGAWATDNSNQDMDVETLGASDVDINVAGTYYITYKAIDISGNQSEVIRTVIVE